MRVTAEEIRVAVRYAGVGGPAHVRAVVLATDGALALVTEAAV